MRVMLDIYDDIVPPDEKDADKPKEEEEEGDDVDAVEKEKKQKPTPPVLSVEDALKSEIESIKEDDKIENKKFKISSNQSSSSLQQANSKWSFFVKSSI